MYRLPEYEYYRASNLEEVLKLLAELDNVKVLAGGTDLVLDMKTGRYKPKYVVDVGGLKELKYIEDAGTALRIGALVTVQELLDSPVIRGKAPLLTLAAREFAYWQIRNVATIGGNLCNASPAADMAPPLLVYEASVKAMSTRGSRLIPLVEFFQGPRKTALAKDELLVEVIVPYRQVEGYGFAYAKVGRRRGHDMSIVAVAVALKLESNVVSDVRVALNSVAPVPTRAYTVERALRRKTFTPESVEEAARLVEKDIKPITDVRAPAEYRLYMSKLLVKELLLEAAKSTRGGGVS